MAQELKRKVSEVPAEAANQALEKLVDEYGNEKLELAKIEAQIEKRVQALQVKANAISDYADQLKTTIMAATEDWDPEEERTIQGHAFEAKIGKKKQNREITDIKAVRKFVGPDNFLKIVSVRLGDLDAYLNPNQLSQCVKTEHDGARSFKVKPRK